MSLPSRGARIEMFPSLARCCLLRSLPSRGARIEILLPRDLLYLSAVAPLTGSAD